MRNVIVDITRGEKHFLVGVTLNYKAGEIEINSVSGLFPKESHEWIKWIQDGKAIRIDQKEKVQQLISSLRTNPAESTRIGLNLDEVAKIVNSFDNPAFDTKEFDGHPEGDIRMREVESGHAVKLAKKLNTPVRIVTDPTEIMHADPKRQEAMRRSKGFYNVESGEVTIVLPNNRDVEDVAATVFHEVVAHKGLRELVGEENYDAFCDEIYEHLEDELKEQVDTETTRHFADDFAKGREHARRKAVDENLTLRNDAMMSIGGNLASLRKAMAAQKRFDQSTVKRVVDLARVLMQNGLGSKSAEEARLCASALVAYRAGMVKVLESEDADAQQEAKKELTGVMQEFMPKIEAMIKERDLRTSIRLHMHRYISMMSEVRTQ